MSARSDRILPGFANLNMVRAGAVGHPREWSWCGYDELVGERAKFLVLDRAKLEFGETEGGAWTLKEPECPYGRELET